jgi:hypothetical protein
MDGHTVTRHVARPMGLVAVVALLHHHSWLRLLIVVPLLALIGCTALPGAASPTGSTPTATAGAQAPASLAAMPTATVVKTARTNRYQSITLSPPGDVVPAVSSDAAYKVCQTPDGDCFTEPPTAIELARMTQTAVGMDLPALTNVLVWVIGWYGVTDCTFVGGPGGSAPAAPPSAAPLCDHASYINATTGEFMFGTSNAHE